MLAKREEEIIELLRNCNNSDLNSIRILTEMETKRRNKGKCTCEGFHKPRSCPVHGNLNHD